MGSFSSRGPQTLSAHLLKVRTKRDKKFQWYSLSILLFLLFSLLCSLLMKEFNEQPDIVAPGLDILAGYSKLASVSGDPKDKRFVNFNIITGTSMACPHVAAAAAYVKTFHPRWSPAAIKSALMTTGERLNQISKSFKPPLHC